MLKVLKKRCGFPVEGDNSVQCKEKKVHIYKLYIVTLQWPVIGPFTHRGHRDPRVCPGSLQSSAAASDVEVSISATAARAPPGSSLTLV